ncbi:uncharacterized protein PRCAT00003879001 [Priceomyces carsonii]|uniref:uncharacterized protein n=1 Tax=Priceomyces carsonii TaxID=28549 RepID=UPI002EDADF0F|nr:unnamed protein product [Priceomyces carsonii]
MNIDILTPSNRVHLSSNQKISAIHYFHRKLFVGFFNGDLSIYSTPIGKTEYDRTTSRSLKSAKSISEIHGLFNNDDQSQKITLDNTFKNASRDQSGITRIECLQVLEGDNRNIIILASNDSIKVFERVGYHLNFIADLEDTKNFTDFYCFCSQERKLIIVGVKKKLIFYLLKKKSRNIIQVFKIKELTFKDKIKAIGSSSSQNMCWIIVALTSDFFVVDVDDDFNFEPLAYNDTLSGFSHSNSFSYFGLSSSGPKTWILNASQDKVLLVKDNQVAVSIRKEKTFSISSVPIKFSVAPLYIAFIYPLYLLVVYNKKLEVLDVDTGYLIQKFHHHLNSGQIQVTFENESFFLGSGTDILEFNILAYQKQIDQYLSISGKDSSSKGARDPHNDLKYIGLEKAISLVSKLSASCSFFEGSNIEPMKKKQLILRDLYKSKAFLLFESYSKFHESLVEICSEWLIAYTDVLDLFPDFIHWNNSPSKIQSDTESISSINYNIVKRISLKDLQHSKETLGESGTENEALERQSLKSGNIVTGRAQSNLMKSQNVRKFKKAVFNLIIYLTDQRRILSTFLDDPNSTLAWKGLDITPYDIYPHIDSHDLTLELTKIAEDIDTTLFLCYFHTKPMLMGPLLRLPNNHCNTLIVNDYLLYNLHNHNEQGPVFIKELLDFYYGRGLHKDALQMLYELSHHKPQDHDNEFDDFLLEPTLTIQYLRKLSNEHLDLIFEYSKWAIQENPKTSMQNSELIFMNDSYECESYNCNKVLKYFLHDIKSNEMAIRYLEWLIFDSEIIDISEKQHEKSRFHTKLCLLYLEELLNVSEISKSPYYEKLCKFLQTTNSYEPWTVLKNIPTNEDEYLRLTVFVYKRLGEHEKAIDVYFNQLNDLDLAMKYCSEIYRQPNNEHVGQLLLHKLLEDLLTHSEENIDRIEILLNLQGSKMSVVKTLAALPNSFPLSSVAGFLTENLRKTTETLHDTRAYSQLYKVGMIKLQDELLTSQSKGYSIESGRELCPICNKRLGYGIFTVDKKDDVVHYGCYQRLRDSNSI